jgi:ribosome maturation factor RimP
MKPPAPPGGRPADVVTALIAASLAGAGFDIEEVSIRKAGSRAVVAIAVDRDGGVDLDAVADASRLVSAELDAAEDRLPAVLRAAYTLEVTSRGADSPLTEPRHWRRAIGRLVESRGSRGVITGRVSSADDDGVELATAKGPVRIAYADAGKAVVQLEFTRAPGDALSDVDAPDLDAPDLDNDEVFDDDVDDEEVGS